MALTVLSGIQSHRSRWCGGYWTATILADEAEPSGHRACPIRYQRRTWSATEAILYGSPLILRAGVAADIGHINTKSVVTGYQPDADGLKQALTGAEIVLIPAGVPRKPGMTRDGAVLLSFPIHVYPPLPNSLLTKPAHRPLQH